MRRVVFCVSGDEEGDLLGGGGGADGGGGGGGGCVGCAVTLRAATSRRTDLIMKED